MLRHPMHWRLKGAIQRALGQLPFGDQLHHRLQMRFGGLSQFNDELARKIEDWGLMARQLEEAGVPVSNARFVEIGTGWYPTFPLCLYLAGAKSVMTVDLNRHLRQNLTLRMTDALGRYLPVIAEVSGRSEGELQRLQRELVSAIRRNAGLDDATGGVVTYCAPCDASATDLPVDSVDVVFSNSVLEHVPAPVISRCFVEARRILRLGGVMFHSVNCGDHYAYVDRTIHQLNYLRFSDADWRRWNNKFLYQNRLRAVDFVDMARAAGFTIEVDSSRPHPKRLQQLQTISVAPEFARYTREQLAITSIDFIGRKLAG